MDNLSILAMRTCVLRTWHCVGEALVKYNTNPLWNNKWFKNPSDLLTHWDFFWPFAAYKLICVQVNHISQGGWDRHHQLQREGFQTESRWQSLSTKSDSRNGSPIHHWPFGNILFSQSEAPFQTRWCYLLIRCQDEKVWHSKGFIVPPEVQSESSKKKKKHNQTKFFFKYAWRFAPSPLEKILWNSGSFFSTISSKSHYW